MSLSFGGGAGVLTIPGVSSDGQTPGGIVVAGAVLAGDSNASVIPTTHNITGKLECYDSPANLSNGDPILYVYEVSPLSANANSSAAQFIRDGPLNGHQYTAPIILVADNTGTSALLQEWDNPNGQVACIGREGGLGLFGVAAPTAPRTLAQATITAITDANAKASVQACANALADMGVLTLT